MASEVLTVEPDGDEYRIARRGANERKARAASPAADAQGLVEFACECRRANCQSGW